VTRVEREKEGEKEKKGRTRESGEGEREEEGRGSSSTEVVRSRCPCFSRSITTRGKDRAGSFRNSGATTARSSSIFREKTVEDELD
jgi:hypothetical protein